MPRTHDEIVLDIKRDYHSDLSPTKSVLEYIGLEHIEDVLTKRWNIAKFYKFGQKYSFINYYMVKFQEDDNRWWHAKNIYDNIILDLGESYEAATGEEALKASYAKQEYNHLVLLIDTAIEEAKTSSNLNGMDTFVNKLTDAKSVLVFNN